MKAEQIILIVAGAIILAIVIALVCCGKIQTVKNWLKYAVTEAEQYFGGKTGQLKLQYVYAKFAEKFKILSAFITFSVFEAWVDAALETLNKWLDTSPAIAEVVEHKTLISVEGKTDETEDKDNACNN